jgi:hypothetical protein
MKLISPLENVRGVDDTKSLGSILGAQSLQTGINQVAQLATKGLAS